MHRESFFISAFVVIVLGLLILFFGLISASVEIGSVGTAVMIFGFIAVRLNLVASERVTRFVDAFGFSPIGLTIKEIRGMQSVVDSALSVLAKSLDNLGRAEAEASVPQVQEGTSAAERLGKMRKAQNDFARGKKLFWEAHGLAMRYRFPVKESYKSYL